MKIGEKGRKILFSGIIKEILGFFGDIFAFYRDNVSEKWLRIILIVISIFTLYVLFNELLGLGED